MTGQFVPHHPLVARGSGSSRARDHAASTMVCTPCSLAQEVGLALGAQAGEQRLSQVVSEGGFSRCRRAAETPFNIVLEVRR